MTLALGFTTSTECLDDVFGMDMNNNDLFVTGLKKMVLVHDCDDRAMC